MEHTGFHHESDRGEAVPIGRLTSCGTEGTVRLVVLNFQNETRRGKPFDRLAVEKLRIDRQTGWRVVERRRKS